MNGTVFFKINKYKVSAEDCYTELQTLKEITPQNVVDLARNEDSKLHNDFEWDNEIAGEKYRLSQAREMIQLLAFEPKEETADISNFESFEIEDKEEELKAELYNLRFANATGNLEKPSKIKEDRKTIARIKQILTERENENK